MILSIFAIDFLSSDLFRAAAEHRYETLRPDAVQAGDAIFVPTRDVASFFAVHHPQITEPYILISHVTDEDAPGESTAWLDDPKLIAWFAINSTQRHPKLIPIPIGVAPASLPHGNLEALAKVAAEHLPKEHLLFMNFTIQTYSQQRWRLFKQFAFAPFCFRSGKKPFEDYLRDLAASKFVLAPRGAGFDTYRLWEALYVGAIPIVKSSPLNALYEGLPILIVQEWDEVTEEFLREKESEFAARAFDIAKLDATWWLDLIASKKG